MKTASILKGKQVNQNVSLVISPGSRAILKALIKNGALSTFISAGARILECSCGPCIGMGQAPPSEGVSVRTFNRNFEGRSATKDAEVYLVSPEVAAATALTGFITDPRELGEPPIIIPPEKFDLDDSLLIWPPKDSAKVNVIRGPNIKPPPPFKRLDDPLEGVVLAKLGDNITTDHILPGGAKVLPLRSNIPEISKYVFSRIDDKFASRALEKGGGFVVGGNNYGQGSSREHAALCPRFLGVKSIIAKSFARIHRDNLINFGILPLKFSSEKDYERLSADDELRVSSIEKTLKTRKDTLLVEDMTQSFSLETNLDLSERQRIILLEGGLLNLLKNRAKKNQ
jgi:aconitate hydratase